MGIKYLYTWFSTPWAFALLALLPVWGIIALFAWRRRRRTLARFGSWPVLHSLTPSRGGWRTFVRQTCLMNGLMLLVAGIAGPQWGTDWEQAAAQGRDLVLVLDMSRSMLAQDVLPSRAERARKALEELTYSIQQRGGHRVAVAVFAARGQIVCPLTHDYDHVRAVLARLDPVHLHPDLRPAGKESTSGTRIGAGIRTALEVHDHDPRYRGYQDILLISDGDDPAHDREWREGAEEARRQHIPVHTVGIGNPSAGSPIPLLGDELLRHDKEIVYTRLEEQVLDQIAQLTRGTYTPARTNAVQLGELFRERIEPGSMRENQEDVLPVYRRHYDLFFAGAFSLLTLQMMVGQKRPRIRNV